MKKALLLIGIALFLFLVTAGIAFAADLDSDKQAIKEQKIEMKEEGAAARAEEKQMGEEVREAIKAGDVEKAKELKAELKETHKENVQEMKAEKKELHHMKKSMKMDAKAVRKAAHKK